jgi:hypothetical protein
MYSLQELWQQAEEDSLAFDMESHLHESKILFGCKIIKDRYSGDIELFNTARGGDYYIKRKKEEVDVFRVYGLQQGVYWLMMSNILRKIEGVNNSIRSEVNGKNNFRRIQTLKNYRERLIKSFHYQTKQFKERNYVTKEIDLGSSVQN